MATSAYIDKVKSLLRMIYDHELTKVPESSDFNSQVQSWSGYLSNVLHIPEDQLLDVYKLALDIRNDNKVSAKFRLQDMQAAWSQITAAGNYKKHVPTTVCSLCKNTGYITVYSPNLMREVRQQCNH